MINSKIILFIIFIQTYSFSQEFNQIFGKETESYVHECLKDIRVNVSNKIIDLNRIDIDTTYFSTDSVLIVEIKTKKNELDIKMVDIANPNFRYSLNINYRKKRFNIYLFYKYFYGTFNEKNEIKKIHYFLAFDFSEKSKSCSCIFNYKTGKHTINDKCNGADIGVNKSNLIGKSEFYKRLVYMLLTFK